MARPKPEEQPVMSHVRGRAGVVKLKLSLMVGDTILRVEVKFKTRLTNGQAVRLFSCAPAYGIEK